MKKGFPKLPFIDDYINHTFTIYPFITKENNALFGTIIVDNKKWQSLLRLLSKSKHTNNMTKIYIYRDLEYNINDFENCDKNFVIHKPIRYVDICQEYLLIVSENKILDNDSFPKLNIYHDEYEKNIKTYKFGMINLNFVTIKKNNKGYNYIEITFQYIKNKFDIILKDLEYVQNLLNK